MKWAGSPWSVWYYLAVFGMKFLMGYGLGSGAWTAIVVRSEFGLNRQIGVWCTGSLFL